ncbi:hypothetical protein BSL78_23867 [Apostichopus japonicus]|uniref:Death domain-containing protein n=1 Tax=Stichopus japonicus TaxID=307972 RepID=A0A2G8JUB8_STIJA|nr:hypothetical protein BSL78_23867 [Apostichopus japonicus]
MYAAGRRGTTDTMYLDFGYYLNLATFEEAISFEDVAISPWYFCTFVLDKTEPKGTDACTCYCKAGQAPNLRNFIFQLKSQLQTVFRAYTNILFTLKEAPDPSSVKQPSTSKRHEDERVGTSTAGIGALDLVVTTATIQDLSHKFCYEWRIVGSKLGIEEPKLQTIDTDNRTAQEKVYQMLLTWKQSKGNEATYRLLGEALQSAGRKDLQENLYQQAGDHHYEQRHGDNSQDGRRSIEEPIHQDERPPEVERTPRELHVGSDGLSTSSGLQHYQTIGSLF